jgi:hypothetical protein
MAKIKPNQVLKYLFCILAGAEEPLCKCTTPL